MSTQITLEQVRWQDLKVRSEVDIVLEIAQKGGWKDCEVFGVGAMIGEPQEANGWKLIPADLYKDSIPPQAVERLHQVINAGIRVQGVIIADDERRTEPAPEMEVISAPVPVPDKPRVSLSSLRPVASWAGNALLGIGHSLGAVMSFLGKVLLGLVGIAAIIFVAIGVINLVSVAVQALARFWLVIPIGLFLFGLANTGTRTSSRSNAGYDYDPQLVILVDDGTGGTAWISLFTWYD